MKFVSASDVRRLLPMVKAIEVVEQTMIRVAEGKANLPLRTVMDIDGTNKLGVMPGVLRDPTLYGVKVLSLFPGNPAKGLSSHIGVVILFDAATGEPVVSMNADAITAIRTAAASAAATRALSRPDAQSLAIIGTGEQAETHIEAISSVRNITELRIAGRTLDRSSAFVAKIGRHYPNLTCRPCSSIKEAVTGAHIVCTVTSSSEVILQGGWLDAGCHVNAVGASVPSMQEIDVGLVLASDLYVDYKPSALAQARDIMTAISSGQMNEAHIRGEIGDVYRGHAPGRSGPEAITLYRSLGVAAQDLACADIVWKAAQPG